MANGRAQIFGGGSIGGVVDAVAGPPPVPTQQYGGVAIPQFTGKNSAALTRAWLARSEFNDWQNRYMPREIELLDRVSKEGAIEELNTRLGDIHADTKLAYEANKKAVDMTKQRYGVETDAALQASQNRRGGIAQSLSEVDAINRTRDSISTRNANVIGGSGMTGRQLING